MFGVCYLFQILVERPIVQSTQSLLQWVEIGLGATLVKLLPLLMLPAFNILDDVEVKSWRVDYDGLVESGRIEDR